MRKNIKIVIEPYSDATSSKTKPSTLEFIYTDKLDDMAIDLKIIENRWSSSNASTMAIYNLPQKLAASLRMSPYRDPRKSHQVTIYVGAESTPFYRGEATQVSTVQSDPTTTKTTFTLGVLFDLLNSSKTERQHSFPVKKGSSIRTLINQTCLPFELRPAFVPIGKATWADTTKIKQTKTYKGNLVTIWARIAEEYKLDIYTANFELMVMPKNSVTYGTRANKITPDTIEAPDLKGVNFTTEFDPTIRPGMLIDVDHDSAKIFNGGLVADTATHTLELPIGAYNTAVETHYWPTPITGT